MKTLRDYITETEAWIDEPATGDDFAINLREECLIETYIVDTTEDGVVLQADEGMMSLLEQYGLIGERIGRYGAVGNNAAMGYSIGEDMSALAHQDEIENDLIGEGDIDPNRHPQTRDYGRGEDEDDLPFEPNQDISHKDQFGNPIKHMARHLARKGMRQAMDDKKEEPMAEDFMSRMLELAGVDATVKETAPSEPETDAAHNNPLAAKAADLAPVGADSSAGRTTTVDEDGVDPVNAAGEDAEELHGNMTAEAKYRGREVKLGKPMAGDVKKSKVYVRGPKGNVVKVNFGDPNMRIKKSNPARRKSFRARHNCDNPGPRWKARYWSCRAW